jgi:hypothetical protein
MHYFKSGIAQNKNTLGTADKRKQIRISDFDYIRQVRDTIFW